MFKFIKKIIQTVTGKYLKNDIEIQEMDMSEIRWFNTIKLCRYYLENNLSAYSRY